MTIRAAEKAKFEQAICLQLEGFQEILQSLLEAKNPKVEYWVLIDVRDLESDVPVWITRRVDGPVFNLTEFQLPYCGSMNIEWLTQSRTLMADGSVQNWTCYFSHRCQEDPPAEQWVQEAEQHGWKRRL